MKFSIIIPVYNGAAVLARCLNSAADLPDTEVLLIDDGSTDKTPDILREFSEKHRNFRIFQQSHQGVSAARNLGLTHASGEFILFLDGDDTLGTLPSTENCSIAGESEILPLFRTEQLCQLWNKVFRGDVIRAGRLRFREELFVYEDLDFVMRYFQAAGNLMLAPEVCHHVPSGLALARAGRLTTMTGLLDNLPAELRPELSPILARQIIAGAPKKIAKILVECKKYSPDFSTLSLIKGAMALRWRL